MITQQQAHKLFFYDKGELRNRIDRGARARAGSAAWHSSFNNRYVSVSGIKYRLDSIVILYHTGHWFNLVAHDDCDPENFDIDNLLGVNLPPVGTVTQEFLNSIFKYHNGQMISKISRSRFRIGHRPGGRNCDGYWRMFVNGRAWKEHQLIFCLFHGHVPEITDHKNLDRSDNRIENLREVSASTNSGNHKVYKNNTSGVTGWKKTGYLYITVNKKRIKLGKFDNIAAAAAARREAEIRYFS